MQPRQICQQVAVHRVAGVLYSLLFRQCYVVKPLADSCIAVRCAGAAAGRRACVEETIRLVGEVIITCFDTW